MWNVLRSFCRVSALLLVFMAVSLSGCGHKSKVEGNNLLAGLSPEVIFEYADGLRNAGNYHAAAEAFSQIEVSYPYSQQGRDAVFLAAESYYQAGEYNQAVETAKRYFILYPQDSDWDRVLYILGRSYQAQLGDVSRDQSVANEALAVFDEIVKNRPDSAYAPEVTQSIGEIRNWLARKEMAVGYYYLQRSHYVGALNRYKTVLSRYPESAEVPEALLRIVEIYVVMGVLQEAQSVALTLGERYPSSPWYQFAVELLQKYQVPLGGLVPEQDQDQQQVELNNVDWESTREYGAQVQANEESESPSLRGYESGYYAETNDYP